MHFPESPNLCHDQVHQYLVVHIQSFIVQWVCLGRSKITVDFDGILYIESSCGKSCCAIGSTILGGCAICFGIFVNLWVQSSFAFPEHVGEL